MQKRRSSTKTKLDPTLHCLQPNAAGVDVGATQIYVSVPPDCRRRRAKGPFWRPTLSPLFPSCPIVSERSSPSRVRYAAPNNGAPLTAPVRSKKTLPLRGKESVLVSGPPRRHFGPFSDCHRQRRGTERG